MKQSSHTGPACLAQIEQHGISHQTKVMNCNYVTMVYLCLRRPHHAAVSNRDDRQSSFSKQIQNELNKIIKFVQAGRPLFLLEVPEALICSLAPTHTVAGSLDTCVVANFPVINLGLWLLIEQRELCASAVAHAVTRNVDLIPLRR